MRNILFVDARTKQRKSYQTDMSDKEWGKIEPYIPTRKKKVDRKRHMGLLLKVIVHAANIYDRDGARIALEKAKGKFPRLQLIWADEEYAGKLIAWVKQICSWTLEIVKRSDDVKGFQVLPHRWVVEHTFGWLNRYRWLSKDYEGLTESSEAMIYIAMISLMVRRLARIKPTSPLRAYPISQLGHIAKVKTFYYLLV